MKRTHKLFFLLFVLCIVPLFALSVSAEETEYIYTEDFRCTVMADGTVNIFSYDGTATEVVIPAEIEGMPVTSIGMYSFSTSPIESIVIPKGVTSIGDYAFQECSNLSNVELPEGVTNIGSRAFYKCTSLMSITLPQGVETIGSGAFNGCTYLRSVSLAEGIKSIGASAFSHCGSLKSITIPNSVTSLGQDLFQSCSKLRNVTLSESITSIPDYMFFNCYELQSVNIPDGVTSIGDYAFCYCGELTELIFPDSLKTVGDCAFSDCTGIKKLNLKNIEYWGVGNPVFAEEIVFSPNMSISAGFCNSSTKKVTIPEGVEVIPENAFWGCENLTTVEIPSTVKIIEAYAFYDCKNLTSIQLPDGLEGIGPGAFFNSGLTSITIPDSVTTLSYGIDSNEAVGTFSCCSNLKTVKLGKGITEIPGACFSETSLETFVIPEGVTRIEAYAFSLCENLTYISISKSVKYIGEYAFVNSHSLTSVVFRGDLPEMNDSFYCASFNGAAFYPKGNATWEKDIGNALWSTGGLVSAVPYTVDNSGKIIPEAPTADEVDAAISLFQMKSGYDQGYPAGSVYPNNWSYILNGNMMKATGEEAFAFEMSDACFGYLPISEKRTVSYSQLRVGDILYDYSDVWVIMEKTSTGLKLAGVQNEKVCYGISMTKAEAETAEGYRTRVGVSPYAGEVDPALSIEKVEGLGHLPTEEEAYEALLSLKAQFPEGMPYSEKNHYNSSTHIPIDDIIVYGGNGHGCSAFGGYASDVLFGSRDGRYVFNKDLQFSDIKVGDRLLTIAHEMIALEVYSDCVVVVEGNYNYRMRWGRVIPREEIENGYDIITRYPEGTTSPARTAFKCTHKYMSCKVPTSDGLVSSCNSCGYSSVEFTATPSPKPTATPTIKPTATPTVKPTAKPTATPTVKPTVKPTPTPKPVKITTQPKTTYTQSGATAKVTVKATGDGLKYAWYIKNSGASKFTKSSTTTSTYSVKMSSTVKDRQVYCVVTDKYGKTVQTNKVYLRMAASITTQPKNTYTQSGATAKVTVKAAGDGLKYTWYVKNKSASKYTKSSTTSATYSVKMSSTTKDRQVYCIVTDKYGKTVQSGKVYLRMAASITTQPKITYTKNGSTAKVTVKAAGDGLKYAWYVKNKSASKYTKSSTTTSTYSVKMSSTTKDRQVYCVVTDKYGKTVQSGKVYLRMAASITTQPKTTYTKNGSTAKVTVKAAGDGLKYTWYVKNSGAKKFTKTSTKTATYSVKMTNTVKNRQVYCVVTDKYGKTVKSGTVYLRMAASITTQPKTVTVKKNATAKVTVKAAGDGLKYTWYVKNKGASKFTKATGTTATYSVKMTSKVNGRQVYCVVKDKYGKTVKTSTATLKMK